MCRIDKLKWVFCKSECVKQKNQVFSCKIDRKCARTDVVALTFMLDGGELKKYLFVTIMNGKILACFITLR